MCLQLCVCQQVKNGIVFPLLKMLGLDLILKNYRPVSNLPFLLKLVEKCMLEQLNTHCNPYDLMPDYQSPYRTYYSCEMALLKLTSDILNTMEYQKAMTLVVLDLSAAFDTMVSCLMSSITDLV